MGEEPCLLVCLLPVRNGEADLPLYLERAAEYVDAVVALDDGSTDATGEILRSHPIVAEILVNPRRPGYAGWDDSANRQRLLQSQACRRLNPRWVFSLDADELLDPADARALRAFLASSAACHRAYGFEVFRMIDDLAHFDKRGLWVDRLFRFEAGQRMPEKRLHFDPIPISIRKKNRARTTIRIQHRAGMSRSRRKARYEKYLEADPDREWQKSYENLLDEARELHKWQTRSPQQPVLCGERRRFPWFRRRRP